MRVRHSLRLLHLLHLIGLGAVAGAFLPASLRAQLPVRRDTAAVQRDTSRVGAVPLPSKTASDSTRTKAAADSAKAKADTIRPPLAHAEAPTILEIGARRIYDRAALFATGALSLSDLLGRVPGLTEFTTGWLGAPSAVASMGDLRRVRLFLDGVELDPMNPRPKGIAAPNDLPIHALEEVRIERGAEEVRVYARSWRVDRTIPYTRADIATGDQNTNLYRAFFGKRFAHGEAFQLAAEQYNTQPERVLPSSDGLHLMLRLGTTHGPWSGDLFAERSDRNRAQWVGSGNNADNVDTLPGLESRRTTAYARIANGDPDRGRWFQLVASTHDYTVSARESNAFLADANPSARDSGTVAPDTTVHVNQYLFTGGMTYGLFRVSAAERLRVAGGRTSFVPSARGSLESTRLGVSVFAEGTSPLNPARIDGTVRLAPLSWITLVGSASHTGSALIERVLGDTVSGRTINEAGAYQPGLLYFFPGYDSSEVSRYMVASRNNLRAEAGIRLRDLWLSAGLMRRGGTTLLPPADLVTGFPDSTSSGTAVRTESEATARTVSVRGRLFRAINADAWAIAWTDSTGLYRPRYQARSELYIQTSLLDRFPKGNFGLLASLAHEYRSSTRFPLRGDSVVTVGDSRTIAFRLEIRIQTAVVSYQFRNVLQERYSLVPGFNMPRQTQFYGVRWEFWN
ncbi:MAG: Plug domain-containing protein [Gemmatimonadaceae bacterium]